MRVSRLMVAAGLGVLVASVGASTLSAQASATRPIAEPRKEPGTIPNEPHTKVLPPEVGLIFLGSYVLDRSLSTGEKEIHVTLVDEQLRFRIGENESRLIFEGIAREESGGAITDVYKFTVVGKPGVQASIKVPRASKRVDYLTYFEEFAKPEIFATGKPKRR
jgi:hypothetical protein